MWGKVGSIAYLGSSVGKREKEKQSGRCSSTHYGGGGGGTDACFSSLPIRIEKIIHPNPNPSENIPRLRKAAKSCAGEYGEMIDAITPTRRNMRPSLRSIADSLGFAFIFQTSFFQTYLRTLTYKTAQQKLGVALGCIRCERLFLALRRLTGG